MVYTSYFDKLEDLPTNVIPVSICGAAPEWYKGAQYRKLAPRLAFFQEWKKNHDNDYYIEHFQSEVICKLSFSRVLADLQLKIPYEIREKMCSDVFNNKDVHIALICYEKPGEFCHRHLVADWFKEHGIECSEWEFENAEN